MTHDRPRARARWRPTAALAVAVGTALLLAACGSDGNSSRTADSTDASEDSSSGSASAYPVTVTNCGKAVTFDAPPERVVILQPLIGRDMVALGLGDTIVGQVGTDYHDPVPELADVPVISSKNVASTEALLGSRPDMVITDFSYRVTPSAGGASMEQLTKAGIDVYIDTAGCDANGLGGTVADNFTDIENLGKIFDRQAEAAELVSALQARLADVQAKVAAEPALVAFNGTSYSGEYYPVSGIGLDALGLAGATSIFPDVTDPNASVSKEQITALNPDAIVDTISASVVPPDEEENLKEAFPTVTAVKEGRLCFINYPESSEPGSATDMVTSIETMAKCLHPDAFAP